MSLGSEFKEFAMKGNVIDLAVGVVIGAAFGKIVGSLVGGCHHAAALGAVIGQHQFQRPRREDRHRSRRQAGAAEVRDLPADDSWNF